MERLIREENLLKFSEEHSFSNKGNRSLQNLAILKKIVSLKNSKFTDLTNVPMDIIRDHWPLSRDKS